MDNQLEALQANRREKRRLAILIAVEYGLEGGVANQGGRLRGFSVKVEPHETLMTLRVEFDSGMKIAFVGSEDLAGCLMKAVRELEGNKLRWRADKFVG